MTARACVCSFTATEVSCVAGEGVTGKVKGHTVAVGSARLAVQTLLESPALITDPGCAGPHALAVAAQEECIRAAVAEWGGKGATTCFVLVDGRLTCVLAAKDETRPTAAEAVEQLAQRHVTCAMLTGKHWSGFCKHHEILCSSHTSQRTRCY